MMINRKYFSDSSQHAPRKQKRRKKKFHFDLSQLIRMCVCFVINREEKAEKKRSRCGENFESHQMKTKLVKIHKHMKDFEPHLRSVGVDNDWELSRTELVNHFSWWSGKLWPEWFSFRINSHLRLLHKLAFNCPKTF